MATTTVTWHFTSTSQSWVFTASGTGNSGAWQSTGGDTGAPGGDAGCLNNVTTGKNHTGAGHWRLSGTWAAIFGIPSNATVTQVGGISGNQHSWSCATYTTGAASTEGPFAVYQSDGTTLIGTFTTGNAYSSTTAYARPTASAVSIIGGLQPASTSVILQLAGSVNTGSSSSANNTLLQDEVTLTITYTVPTVTDNNFLMMMGSGT